MDIHHVSKNKQNYFCYNYVKLPPNPTIFGTKMANFLKLYEVHSFSTSPNLCQCTTVLIAHVSKETKQCEMTIWGTVFCDNKELCSWCVVCCLSVYWSHRMIRSRSLTLARVAAGMTLVQRCRLLARWHGWHRRSFAVNRARRRLTSGINRLVLLIVIKHVVIGSPMIKYFITRF